LDVPTRLSNRKRRLQCSSRLLALPGASLLCSNTAAIEGSSDRLRAIRPQPSMTRRRHRCIAAS
jgi:hypothetical protein